MSESQTLGAFSIEVGGCPSLRSVKERGPTVLKWGQGVGERVTVLKWGQGAGERVGKGWLQCLTVARLVLHCGELSAVLPLLWSETATQEFNQSCHLRVSVCILADVDGNKGWGGWLRQEGPGFWKRIVAGRSGERQGHRGSICNPGGLTSAPKPTCSPFP